jgi:hypothetical protein
VFTLNIPSLDVFAAGKERAHVLCQRGAEELASQIRPALNLIIINKKYKNNTSRDKYSYAFFVTVPDHRRK